MKKLKIIPKMLITFVMCIFAGYMVSYYNLFLFIPTSSMSPTIEKRTFVIAKRLTEEDKKELHRGDIIVFKAQDGVAIRIKDTDFNNFNMVKRVIAVGGDVISIDNGIVKINGEIYQEPYVINKDTFSMGELVVPKDEVFVMGDNRLESFDSRYWTMQTLSLDKIIGKVTSVK